MGKKNLFFLCSLIFLKTIITVEASEERLSEDMKKEFQAIANQYGNVQASDDRLDEMLKKAGIFVLDVEAYNKNLEKDNFGFKCYDPSEGNGFNYPEAAVKLSPQDEQRIIGILLQALKNNPNDEASSQLLVHEEALLVPGSTQPRRIICGFTNIINYQEAKSIADQYLKQEGLGTTETKSGNIVFTKSYLIKEYMGYVKTLLKPEFVTNLWGKGEAVKILDIGAATGANDEELLKRGAIVVANDLGLKHLAAFRGRLSQDQRQRLFLNIDQFPDHFNQPEEDFDAILMSHVAHYLTPSQLRYGIRMIFRWLKPGAKFFFQALTPYSNPYKWRAWTADKLLKLHHEWPGWYGKWNKEAQFLTGLNDYEHGGQMPDFGHPIHPQILERELRSAGFKIEYLNYSAIYAQEKSPITYQDHDKFVKRDSSKDGEETQKAFLLKIYRKLENYPKFRQALEEDHKIYQDAINKRKDLTHPEEPILSLQNSMNAVVAIAVKE